MLKIFLTSPQGGPSYPLEYTVHICTGMPRKLWVGHWEINNVLNKKFFSLEWINNLLNGGSIVVEGIRTVLFCYQDILHKNKTPKYLNTPKTHNKAHSLGKKCPDKIADKKNNQ